jgi:hypothetical protein
MLSVVAAAMLAGLNGCAGLSQQDKDTGIGAGVNDGAVLNENLTINPVLPQTH